MSIAKSTIADVAEEIRQCRIEASFNLRFLAVEMHHFIGKLIVDNFGDDLPSVLPTLSKKCEWSERSLYRSAKLYREYPDLNALPFGKAVSVNKLLGSGVPEKEHCARCKIHCPNAKV